MSEQLSRVEQRQVVNREVAELLGRSAAYSQLPAQEQAAILRNTQEVVDVMVSSKLRDAGSRGRPTADPFAIPMDAPVPPPTIIGLPGQPGAPGSQPPKFTGGATQRREDNIGPKKSTDFGAGVAMGVQQAGELLREVNFPAFVAELVQGVFQAVVDASIQQMKAYGELVQGVTMSLNEFKDQNTTDNQARDHLASKYSSLMQVNIVDGRPRMGLKPGADDADLPNFRDELGLDEDVTSLDEETIEEKLVPAARNELALNRQRLLATMLLMGINRIVVTDGKINAKLRFDFRARDSQQTHAQLFDYANLGTTTVEQHQTESTENTGEGYQENRGWFTGSKSGESQRWTKGVDQVTTTPVITLKNFTDTQTEAEIAAEGQLRSEVSLNFKSETFDLNKLASADQMFQLERVSGAGRAAGPPAAQPPAGRAPAAGATPATPPPAGQRPAAPTPATPPV
jgi:hypothetical protein